MLATYGFQFEQPWWLLTGLLAAPAAWLALRSLKPLGPLRRGVAIALRAIVLLLLAGMLGRPAVTQTHDRLTVLLVVDRSRSVPEAYWSADDPAAVPAWLTRALKHKPPGDQVAVIDVAEMAHIARLPTAAADVPKRNIALTGEETRLAEGVQMALAIAPPNAAVRIVLLTDGNETSGDLRAVAQIAAANGIPLDVLPLTYRYEDEVVFRRLAAPSRARSRDTIALRFVLTSTHEAAGRVQLTLNGRHVDLDPASAGTTAPVRLKKGTNVHAISLPVSERGVHEYEATFIPDDERQDRLTQNNKASAVTFVAGPGHVLVVAEDPREAAALSAALKGKDVTVRQIASSELPQSLTGLLGADAVILVNTPSHAFSQQQQEMLCRYVTEMGGGLVTVGGPDSYGAGGWIGTSVAEILPVDLDPPQKKEMPKGGLCLVMHACEMPNGNFWGKKVAASAVECLSHRDLVGVLDYGWGAGAANWVFPLGPVGDKKAVIAAINRMQMGDMPDFGPPVEAAARALKGSDAAQRHIIIISDSDPAPPSQQQLDDCRKNRITITGVVVFPHDPSQAATLRAVAGYTGGRFYDVKNPNDLPKIFVKEAQVVRRALISEEAFTPLLGPHAPGRILRGLAALPALDGRVLAGPKGWPNQTLLVAPGGEPVLAATQRGVGKVASFTSSADGRWAKSWLASPEYGKFWKQVVDWVGRTPQSTDVEVYSESQGRDVTLTAEAAGGEGAAEPLAGVSGQVISPDMKVHPLELRQVGPGQWRANFRAEQGGSYLVNLRPRRGGQTDDAPGATVQSVVNVPFAPEYDDLTDNSALLNEVAQITGGRKLAGDGDKADLFSRAGLPVPTTASPLTRPLLLIWLALFLVDVAVRRISIDFAAAWRRAMGLLRLGEPSAEAVTLAALKQRQKTVRQRLSESQRSAAGRRFDAGAAPGGGAELPRPDLSAPAAKPRPTEAPKPPPTAEAQRSHVSRLLDAKRRAQQRNEEK
jgi:uncharacterized membrane protein